MKKPKVQHLTIDTPEKYWAIIKGYHVHKGIIGLILIPLGIGIGIELNNFWLGLILFILGWGIVIMDTYGHIHTNWHKRIVFIEKHKGLTYKEGGYKKSEVKKIGY